MLLYRLFNNMVVDWTVQNYKKGRYCLPAVGMMALSDLSAILAVDIRTRRPSDHHGDSRDDVHGDDVVHNVHGAGEANNQDDHHNKAG